MIKRKTIMKQKSRELIFFSHVVKTHIVFTMCQVLSTLTSLILTAIIWVGTVIISISQMGKLRLWFQNL